MVGSVEPDHLEGKGLCPIIGWILEGDGQIDLPKWHDLLSRHDAVETRSGLLDMRSVDAMASSVLAYMMLRSLPPSISTLVCHFVPMIGLTTSRYHPGCGMHSGWSVRSKVMADSDHWRKVGMAGSVV